MRGVSFLTDKFNEFCIEKNTLIYLNRPRLSVSFRIVHRDFNFEGPEGRASEFLGDDSLVAQWAALNVQPDILINESGSLNDECVAFPFSNGVAIPPGLNIFS